MVHHFFKISRSFTRITLSKTLIILMFSAFVMPGMSSCSKQVCAAYTNNVDGVQYKKKKKKRDRRRQEGMDKRIYKW